MMAPVGPRRRTRLLVTADAASRLAAAREWLEALPADGGALVIAPGWEACDDLVRSALGPAGARFGVVRITLGRLAARLAASDLAARGCVPVTELGLLAVAARAAHRLAAERAFTYFGPLVDGPGFGPALARALEGLAMGGVTFEELRGLPQGGPDLARLAEAVADELSRDGLADRAALYHAAVTAAARVPAPHPVGLPVLLLDVPLTSAAEEALVAAFARSADAVFASAPAGDASSIVRLERALGCEAERGRGATGRSLAVLQGHLFETVAPPEAALDDSVSLTAWPGEARECVEIGRAIQHEAAKGTPFDRMAVLLHAPADYVAHLEEAFARAAIPYFFSRATRRPHPGGRPLLALLRGGGIVGPSLRRVPVAGPGTGPGAAHRPGRRLDGARERPGRATRARSACAGERAGARSRRGSRGVRLAANAGTLGASARRGG